jgi:hypothetical protein
VDEDGTVNEFDDLVLMRFSAVLGLRTEIGLMTDAELPERALMLLFEARSWVLIELRVVELIPFMAAWMSLMICWWSLSLPSSSSRVDGRVVG